MADLRNQGFILGRLADYCDFRQRFRSDVRDPVYYMWEKLQEIEGPLSILKQELLNDAIALFLKKLKAYELKEEELADFRQLLDVYIGPGDFADASFHLTDPRLFNDGERQAIAEEFFKDLKAHKLLSEELREPEKRNRNWERIVGDLYKRMSFDVLERMIPRKAMTLARMKIFLRRVRFNTAEYCAVLHFPSSPEDSFTPFILPRIEALIAANRRLLAKLRSGAGEQPAS